MSMSILGRNFLQNNFFKGVADPSLGYLNSDFITPGSRKTRNESASHRIGLGANADSFTFNGGNGQAGEPTPIPINRTDPNQWIQDTKTGVWGKVYTNTRNESVLITNQDAKVKIDNALILEKMA